MMSMSMSSEARQRERERQDRELLAYLARRQAPTRAEIVNVADAARALDWPVQTVLGTAERLKAQWLVQLVDALEPEPYLFITSEGRRCLSRG